MGQAGQEGAVVASVGVGVAGGDQVVKSQAVGTQAASSGLDTGWAEARAGPGAGLRGTTSKLRPTWQWGCTGPPWEMGSL